MLFRAVSRIYLLVMLLRRLLHHSCNMSIKSTFTNIKLSDGNVVPGIGFGGEQKSGNVRHRDCGGG